jgi:hypothetical protein
MAHLAKYNVDYHPKGQKLSPKPSHPHTRKFWGLSGILARMWRIQQLPTSSSSRTERNHVR